MRGVASTWFAIACCLWGAAARAQAGGTRFSLDYSVPKGCPERSAFVASLVSRSRGAHEAESPRVALDVVLSGSHELATGTLLVRLADGQESRREIPEARCAEVLSSMTVIAAMILDGGGLDAPLPVASVGAPSREAVATPPMRARPNTRIEARTDFERRAPSSSSSGVRLAGLVGLGPQTGVGPSLVPRFFAGLGLVFERGGRLPPTLDLLASFAWSPRVVSADGGAMFRLFTLNLTGCALGWPLSTRLALRPCLPLEFGVLHGAGDSNRSAREQRMPWLGAGAGLRLEAQLSRTFLLDLEARTTVLAWADRFVFEPDNLVHDVPRAVFGLRLGGALRVP